MKAAISAVKKAPDNSAAQRALAQALTAAQSLRTAAAVATQGKLPAEGAAASPATRTAADEDSSENQDQESR